MSEKRFSLDDESRIWDNETPMTALNIVFMLNEQQATISKQLDQIIELQDKYRILEFNHSRLEKRNKAQYEKIGEQQATIQRMKHSLNTIYKAFEKHYGYDMRNAVWLIDELSYDEIVDELYIAETDSKNRKEASMYWKKKVDEQQATINKLQDLCGESDGENAKLRIENKELQEEIKLLKPTNVEQYEQIVQLQEENEKLRKELGDCEKFRYTVFKRLNEEYKKECSIR